jgi:peptidyl-prolyl cis-trans isomerase A (cyclophilin A)
MRFVTLCLIVVLSLFCAIAAASAADQAGAAPNKEKLMNPAALTEKAPDVFQAKFETTAGTFVIEVTRAWAPNGADRFYNLVKNGYYDNCRFFRVLKNFMAQFGINGDPKLNAVWRQAQIKDDPVKKSNTRGYVSYAMAGPNTRTTQLFINYNDTNAQLDGQGFSPFGKVVDGMKVVDSLYAAYGEGGQGGPDQNRIQMEGNAYLDKGFPKLDAIISATIVAKPPAEKK